MVEKLPATSEDGCLEDTLENVDFEEALKYTGYGKHDIYLTIVCGLTIFISNVESCSVGYILPMIGCDMNLDTYYKGLLASANLIGLTGSCPIWGYVSDRKGRRTTLIICLFFSFISSFMAPFMTSFWGFSIARFLNGVFISGPSAIIFAYFGEFQTERHREKAMPIFSLFIAVALIYLPGLSWLLVSYDMNINILNLHMNHWRLYLLISSIPNLVMALLLLKLPESPKYLYHSKRTDQSIQILRKIYSINTNSPEISFPVVSLDEKIFLQQAGESRTNNVFDQFKTLLQTQYLIYLVATTFAQAVNFAISSGLMLWYLDIMNRLASFNDTSSQLTVCISLKTFREQNSNECIFEDESFIQSLAVGASYVGGYVLWGIFSGILGNRGYFMFSMGAGAICTIALCFISHPLVVKILFIITLVAPGISVAVINSMALDLFPTSVYGMAVSLMMTAGRLGSVIAGSVAGLSLEWNCMATFLFFGGSLIVNFLLGFIFPKRPNIKNAS